jgi:LytS/YehU family sensor histidine kinase
MSANRYIVDFSRLIRSILSNLEADYVPFDVEITSLKDYLSIEHLRFGDKFDFTVEAGETENIKGLEVFPGLIQPFIENSIWHGVRSLENRKARIKVKFIFREMKSLICIIEDDGIGRKASVENRLRNMVLKYHQPKGIGIVLERLQLISKQQHKNYELVIKDLYPDRNDTGTKVTIDIPFIIKDK